MIRKEEIADYISKYLQEHRNAGDTLEGIVKWWVMSQQLDLSVSTVQQALEQLEASGIVVKNRGADGRTRYLVRAPSNGET